ncbi:MAG: WD40/YVTN/BNR-like repeat-containing protein [Roseiflexus sp.]
MAKAMLLFIGTDDGLVLLSDPAGQGRWLRSAHHLQGSVVQSVWVDSSNPLITLAIADRHVLRSSDGGQTWQTVQIEGDLTATTVLCGDPRRPALVYLPADNRLFESRDAGATWHAIALPGQCSGCAIDGNGRIVVASGNQVLIYTGQSAQWTPLGSPLPGIIRMLVTPPGGGSALCALAGGSVYIFAQDAWRLIDALPQEVVTCAVLGGATPTLLAALAKGGIVRGTVHAWEPTIVALPWESAATALAPVGYHLDIALASSVCGSVAISPDRGRSWTVVRRGLAAVRSVAAARLA